MAAFQWPIDKLLCINSALSQTGDNTVAVADDGSDEWSVASPAYERALAYMIESHGWAQATEVRIMTPAGNVPADNRYDTAYVIPADLVHLIWVRVADAPAGYDLLNGQLVINSRGGPPAPPVTVPPVVPAVVTIKGVFSTDSDPVFSTPTFVIALIAFVMSGIYRGLHEDVAQAERMWNSGKAMLQEAMTRHDQQKPKRSMFNSRITASRRMRRPWPSLPPDWGNTGRPN